jgi:hypothetical protein
VEVDRDHHVYPVRRREGVERVIDAEVARAHDLQLRRVASGKPKPADGVAPDPSRAVEERNFRTLDLDRDAAPHAEAPEGRKEMLDAGEASPRDLERRGAIGPDDLRARELDQRLSYVKGDGAARAPECDP